MLAHLVVALALLSAGVEPVVRELPRDPVVVTMERPPLPEPARVPDPVPDDPGEKAATAPVVAEQTVAAKAVLRPPVRVTPTPVAVETVPAPPVGMVEAVASVSEAELVGARVAGSGTDGDGSAGSGAGAGGTGGRCDMVRRLEDALREDPDIRSALIAAHREAGLGRGALVVWDGDWVRSSGQDGRGLAGVRQAIAVEVAFAPAACRAEGLNGRVVIALEDGPGAARMVLGSGAWRWSDLLGARR